MKNLIKIFCILSLIVITAGCTSVETSKTDDSCSIVKDMYYWKLKAYRIKCQEGTYRCIHGVYSLQCFKLEGNE